MPNNYITILPGDTGTYECNQEYTINYDNNNLPHLIPNYIPDDLKQGDRVESVTYVYPCYNYLRNCDTFITVIYKENEYNKEEINYDLADKTYVNIIIMEIETELKQLSLDDTTFRKITNKLKSLCKKQSIDIDYINKILREIYGNPKPNEIRIDTIQPLLYELMTVLAIQSEHESIKRKKKANSQQ